MTNKTKKSKSKNTKCTKYSPLLNVSIALHLSKHQKHLILWAHILFFYINTPTKLHVYLLDNSYSTTRILHHVATYTPKQHPVNTFKILYTINHLNPKNTFNYISIFIGLIICSYAYYLLMAPRPLLPRTRESSFRRFTASQSFSLGSPQYTFATTLAFISPKSIRI